MSPHASGVAPRGCSDPIVRGVAPQGSEWGVPNVVYVHVDQGSVPHYGWQTDCPSRTCGFLMGWYYEDESPVNDGTFHGYYGA